MAKASAEADTRNQPARTRYEPSGNGDELYADTNGFDLQDLLDAMETVRTGDFSVRLPRDFTGLPGKVADAFNEIVAANQHMAEQLARVGLVVGRQGETRHRVRFAQSQGSWGAMENSVNNLIDDLLWPTTAVTHAIAAVARGDLLQTVELEVGGRPLKG